MGWNGTTFLWAGCWKGVSLQAIVYKSFFSWSFWQSVNGFKCIITTLWALHASTSITLIVKSQKTNQRQSQSYMPVWSWVMVHLLADGMKPKQTRCKVEHRASQHDSDPIKKTVDMRAALIWSCVRPEWTKCTWTCSKMHLRPHWWSGWERSGRCGSRSVPPLTTGWRSTPAPPAQWTRVKKTATDVFCLTRGHWLNSGTAGDSTMADHYVTWLKPVTVREWSL